MWEPQWRGLINDYTYDIDGSAVDANGDPLVANIQVECVDVFDYLGGYGLTPGLDGVVPVAAGFSAGTVYYAETAGTNDDRIIEVLTDGGIDATMYVVFSGNTRLQEANYEADDSALVVLRDCADADFPFIANLYVDRFGRFVFHGRLSRFDPEAVIAGGPVSTDTWDFHSWKVGDGKAILADSGRAQMRVLGFTDGRSNVINAAIAYPKGIAEADIPGQATVDATSFTAYGKHTPPGAMIDLLLKEGVTTGNSGNVESAKFAQLLVENQKDPRPAITALQLKALRPDDDRAATTWAMLTQSDISDRVNVKVGYPGGTGFAGGSPDDDYYIEGRQMRIRPLDGGYDYVELDLEVSPAVWSMDTHGVFA